jgi:hypothetical protein
MHNQSIIMPRYKFGAVCSKAFVLYLCNGASNGGPGVGSAPATAVAAAPPTVVVVGCVPAAVPAAVSRVPSRVGEPPSAAAGAVAVRAPAAVPALSGDHRRSSCCQRECLLGHPQPFGSCLSKTIIIFLFFSCFLQCRINYGVRYLFSQFLISIPLLIFLVY